MIGDGFVKVWCDKEGCMNEEEYEMTALASRGSYDIRFVPGQMKRDGWTFNGELTICPDCSEDSGE